MPIPQSAKIFVSGHRGLVGSAIIRNLRSHGYENLLTVPRLKLDLRNQSAVHDWFQANQPEYVYFAAGTVGGILANSTRQAEFLYDNMMMHANVLEASRQFKVKKLLYLGSSCIYPRNAPQPITEDSLLTGELEPTNEGYALAKITGIKLCDFYRQQYGCNFISAMPTNLYGPNDNFDLKSSHVLPALMRKFHEALQEKKRDVEIWGTGQAMREFLYVDDLAECCNFLMENYSETGHINVGTGLDLTIASLAETIRNIIYPGAELTFDLTKPDGTPRKVLDVSKLSALGWHASTSLQTGLENTYRWFLENEPNLRLL
jgi:GDP-L-fucose synthase